MAQAKLAASLGTQTSEDALPPAHFPQAQQDQENLLGEVITWRAALASIWEDKGQTALMLCQQALALLSVENVMARAQVAFAQSNAYYTSTANDAVAAIESGIQGGMLAQTGGQPTLSIIVMSTTARYMIGAGRLHEAYQLARQAIPFDEKPERRASPEVGYPMAIQAEVLHKWNQLDAALSLAQEAIALCQQIESHAFLLYIFSAYAVLLRISLSCGDLETAHSALQQVERISMILNQPFSLMMRSHFTTVDQVRLWLVGGELDRATRWVEELDLRARHGTPFALEREEVACARVLLAQKQPALALQRLSPALQRAVKGQRWGHVIEIQLLQALTYQMCHEQRQALDALSQAVRLAEPEGSIRSFVDEGAPMAALLTKLRQEQGKVRSSPYLDTVLAAFAQQSKEHTHQPKRAGEPSKIQPLSKSLSEREFQVLQLLARGASNLEIAQELVIVVDTVKRHVSHIFSKLGVQNRVQAVRQAGELGLLDEER